MSNTEENQNADSNRGDNEASEGEAAADLDLDEQFRAAMAELAAEEGDLNSDAEEEELLITGGQGDPSRMVLTKEEREWALQVKAAITQDSDLDNLTDFVYSQLALSVPRGQMQEAMEKAHGLQALRRDKRLLDTSSQAKRIVKEFMEMFPGYLLALHPNELEGGYIFVFDSTKQDAFTFSSNPKAFDLWISTLYYALSAATCDFESNRQGLSLHVECAGFDFLKHFGIKVFTKVWTEGGLAFPVRWKALKHFHTSMFKNLLVSMAKRFIPKETHRKFQVGCISEAGLLDKVYQTPDAAAANRRFEENIMECLQRRFENERTFSL